MRAKNSGGFLLNRDTKLWTECKKSNSDDDEKENSVPGIELPFAGGAIPQGSPGITADLLIRNLA